MRIAKWDNLKFGLIYCVVMGHFIQIMKCDSGFLRGLQFFIYTFHMPAFLFISGLFSKRTVDGRRYDKILPYFFLYLFMKVLRFIVHFLIHGKAGGFRLLSESGVPWFALTLFLCYLLTIALSRFRFPYILAVSVILGVMAGYDSSLGDFLTGMRLFTFYPFFLAGYCVPLEVVERFTRKKAVRICSAAALAGALILSFVFERQLYARLGFLKGKASYEALNIGGAGGLYRGVYYVIAMFLIICVIAVTPSVQCVLSKWGGRTLQVFALHFSVLRVLVEGLHLKEWLKAVLPGYYGYLVPVMALLLTVALSAGVFEPFFKYVIYPGKNGKK